MRDLSLNLPSWAYLKGYRLEGGGGTYDELYLYKHWEVVRRWDCMEKIPNIFEMEEIIHEIENKKIASRC